ncbi:MAG TPA: DUF6538 domain-containing protein, partial [Sphingomicrobium sp.]
MRVPDAVRPLLGRSEVRRSLLTASSLQARLLAARYAARVLEAFNVIVQSQCSPEQARAVVRGCFSDLICETERYGGFVPRTCDPDLETAEQIFLSQERVGQLTGQVASCAFDGFVSGTLQNGLAKHGIGLQAVNSVTELNLLTGIARALIEQQRLFQLRAVDRL